MSNGNEKVVAEWPKHLTNEGQKLEPLPEEGDTDYVLVRFQGTRNDMHIERVTENLRKRVEAWGDEVGIAYVVVRQSGSKHAPKNAWTIVRGMFDYLLNWSKR